MSENKNILYFYDEIYDVKLAYSDVIRGYSYDFDHKIYVKHFSELDKISVIEKRQEIYKTLISRGVKTDKEAIAYLISQDIWSLENEEEIANLEITIDDNSKQADLIVSPGQKNVVLNLINQDRDKLNKIKNERAELVGLTAEKYADDKHSNYYLYFSFFKDKNLSERFFSELDFKNLEEEEVYDYFKIYNNNISHLNSAVFKKIAVSPFFLNSISFAYENPRLFLDKIYNEYTTYQQEIYFLGKRNVKVLSETSANSPVIHSRTLYQDLINWYDLQHTVNENKRKEESGQSRGSVRSSISSN